MTNSPVNLSDPATQARIEAAMAKARRERSLAFRELIGAPWRALREALGRETAPASHGLAAGAPCRG